MKTPKRINKELLDDELLQLINTTTKIFPLTQVDIDTNNNPYDYEYGRVDNAIYRWDTDHWTYILADDPNIDWVDIKNKPASYTPSTHTHDGLHEHTNKSILDSVTEVLMNTWNTVTGKADEVHSHTESDIIDLDKYTKLEIDTALSGKADTSHNHDDTYYTESEIDTKLLGKADSLHNHDGAYFTESEVTGLLSGKSDTNHTHADLHTHSNKSSIDKLIDTGTELTYDIKYLKDIENVMNGYTEGHSHTNWSLLETITQILVDGWNSAVSHISDAIKHITSEERTLWNTVSNKSDSTHTHDYAPTTHNHDDTYYTETEVGTLLSGKSDTGHTHDDRYYTESEVTTALSSKADTTSLTGHTGNTTVHVTQTDKDNWNGKAEGTHTHPYSPNTHNHTLASLSEKSYNSLTDKPTIPSAYTHPSTHPYSMITGTPKSLPANGGNADTVDGVHASGFIQTPGSSSQFISSNSSGSINPDDTLVNGLYYCTVSLFGMSDGALYNQAYSNIWQGQIYQDYRTGRLAVRGKNNGTWQPWRAIHSDGTINQALPNTSYTSPQTRNIILSTADPSGGGNGDVWIKYTP